MVFFATGGALAPVPDPPLPALLAKHLCLSGQDYDGNTFFFEWKGKRITVIFIRRKKEVQET
jgi:hypothetical protein